MKTPATLAAILGLLILSQSGCNSEVESTAEASVETHGEAGGSEEQGHKIIVTSPVKEDVTTTQPYVCQIHSCQHIEIRALEGGYLQELHFKEGQAVKTGELMFRIVPAIYKAKLDSEVAEANRVEIVLKNAQQLADKGIVSSQEIALKKAELAKAQANVELAQAELNFTEVKAPFDGIVDRQRTQLGSLIEEGDVLTTYSDNSTMWAYFNVPEANYLEYKTELDNAKKAGAAEPNLKIELKLANGKIFPQPGAIGAIEADFNNTTGNIAFRADFSNPDGLLRNGQTGTILIHHVLHDAVVIPQRATFEILDKRYVYVVGEDHIVHQRDVSIGPVLDDIFVIQDGLSEGDKIILEGIRQVRDGESIEFEFKSPEEVLANLKYHAE